MTQAESFARLVAERYSCRAFSPAEVSPADIDYIIEQVRMAPSACNRQPWRIMIIGPDDSRRDIVCEAYSREWFTGAPYYFIMCGDVTEGWVRTEDSHSHIDVDLAIATEHLCLSATAVGLGTCWVCNFNPSILSAGLNLPDSLVPIAIIPLGHPAPDSAIPEKKRKDVADIIIP